VISMKIKNFFLALVPPVIIISVWYYASNFGGVPTAILPKITDVFKALIATTKSGQRLILRRIANVQCVVRIQQFLSQ